MQIGPHHSNFVIQQLIDLTTSTVENTHYVDEDLYSYQSDILFSVQRNTGATFKLYLLFEHKSHPDKNTLLQLLKYMRQIHEEQKTYEPIIAMVFHHGPEKWNIPQTFQEQSTLTEQEKAVFGNYALNFRYILIDVKDLHIAELQTSLVLKVFLAALKNIWELSTEEDLKQFFIDNKQIFFEATPEYFLEKLLAYIYRVKNIQPQRLGKLISETISEEKAQMALTIVGKLEKEAELRGELRGKLEGKLEDARKMKKKGYLMDDIMDITGLSREEIQQAGL